MEKPVLGVNSGTRMPYSDIASSTFLYFRYFEEKSEFMASTFRYLGGNGWNQVRISEIRELGVHKGWKSSLWEQLTELGCRKVGIASG